MADNAVIAIDTETGESKSIVSGPLAVAGDIAISGPAGEETIYVADLFSIRKIDLKNNSVSEVARVWSSNIDYPMSISASGGSFTVAALTAGAIQSFDDEGKPLALHHGFTTPADAIVLDDGSVLVSEYARGAIVKATGDDLDERNDLATGLNGPSMMLLDGKGGLLVTERDGGTISRVDLATGERSLVAEGLSAPEGFDIAPGGRLIVAEVGKRRIVSIDPETGTKETVAEDLPIGFDGPDGAPALFIPTGVAVAENGDIYFSSDVDARIYRLKKG